MVTYKARSRRRTVRRLETNVIHCCKARAGLKKLPDGDFLLTAQVLQQCLEPVAQAPGLVETLPQSVEVHLQHAHRCEALVVQAFADLVERKAHLL